MGDNQPYVTIRARRPGDASSASSSDGLGDFAAPSATHDTSRVNFHVKHIDNFAKTLEDSASRAFPNRGRSLQRYKKVQALLLHWKSDDLFVLPELEDLERTLREDYSFDTDVFPIPSENSHLELMLKVGALIKDHEATDTLFLVYYGGHARIDESRQSTWCATRHSSSPWLQWSAIQTLLERSVADTLILLDCCAGAASATFPNGKSITETISASSWDAIAPDPGRYSFTNALIEVLAEWRLRTFSAAMLHAEVLARLKHPRPITINGKHFEARSTPVHFMMTSNHKAPSIELGRILPSSQRPPSPPQDLSDSESSPPYGRGPGGGPVAEPTEDEPHVMISLALEDDQRLDLNAWEQWLSAFPALAKYVKVQGVFKSHSTLLLLSMPVMIWDLLPEDQACSFVAFIRSNNLAQQTAGSPPVISLNSTQRLRDGESEEDDDDTDRRSVLSGTTFAPTERRASSIMRPQSMASTAGRDSYQRGGGNAASLRGSYRRMATEPNMAPFDDTLQSPIHQRSMINLMPKTSGTGLSLQRQPSNLSAFTIDARPDDSIARRAILNQQRSSRRTTYDREDDLPDGRPLSNHIVQRLEEYYSKDPSPNVAVTEFFASNLGIETRDIDLWFHRRRQQERMNYNLQNLKIDDLPPAIPQGAKMSLPGHLHKLLEIFPPSQILVVDLRSPTDFEKSHIYGAINLRVPVSLVEHNFELIERAFTDDHSRRNFSKWHSAKCVVVYDRVVEFTWECPIANALYEKFKQRGWDGEFYILKGHYREFSKSFDKYITGDKMTQAAKDYADGLREKPPLSQAEQKRAQEQYDEWLRLLENEDRVPPTELIPSKKAERQRDVEQHQEELEAALEARNPVLYRKLRDLRPSITPRSASDKLWDDQAVGKGKKGVSDHHHGYEKQEPIPDLVGPLARGLDKMHEAGGGYHSSSNSPPPPPPPPKQGYPPRADSYDRLGSYDKLGESFPSEDFDEIDPRDEAFHSDPAFHRAGDVSGDPRKAAAAASDRSFWKRLRSAK